MFAKATGELRKAVKIEQQLAEATDKTVAGLRGGAGQ